MRDRVEFSNRGPGDKVVEILRKEVEECHRPFLFLSI